MCRCPTGRIDPQCSIAGCSSLAWTVPIDLDCAYASLLATAQIPPVLSAWGARLGRCRVGTGPGCVCGTAAAVPRSPRTSGGYVAGREQLPLRSGWALQRPWRFLSGRRTRARPCRVRLPDVAAGTQAVGGDGVVADHVQPEGFPATRRPVSSCLLPASGPRSWPSTGPCRATPAAAPSAGWPLACGCGSRDNTPHAPGARSLPRAAVPAGRAPSPGPGAHGWRDLTFHTVAEQLRL